MQCCGSGPEWIYIDLRRLDIRIRIQLGKYDQLKLQKIYLNFFYCFDVFDVLYED